MTHRFASASAVLLAALAIGPVVASADTNGSPVRVGATGTLTATLPPHIEAIPVADDADVIVSLAPAGAGDAIYTLTFVPTRPGTFDLSDYLRTVDGQKPAAVGPLVITAFSRLSASDDLSAVAVPLTSPPRFGGYKVAAGVAICAWAALLVPLTFWKRPRRVRAAVPVPSAALPTHDEQLHSLVDQLHNAAPSLGQKVRLETLLLDHWRRRLEVDGLPMNDALHAIRRTPEGRPVLDDLDRGLHAPAADENGVAAVLAACTTALNGRAES